MSATPPSQAVTITLRYGQTRSNDADIEMAIDSQRKDDNPGPPSSSGDASGGTQCRELQPEVPVEEEDFETVALSQCHLYTSSESVSEHLKKLRIEMNALKIEIDQLHRRNIFKDKGKEFEGSYLRIIVIMAISYLTIFGYLSIRGNPTAALDAVVPAVGFNISTWSLPYVKLLWIRYHTNIGRNEINNLSDKIKESPLTRAQQESEPVNITQQLMISQTPMRFYQTGYVYT